MAVHSSPNNIERRRIIRKTWGEKIKKLPGVKVLYVFGKTNDNTEIKVVIRFFDIPNIRSFYRLR